MKRYYINYYRDFGNTYNLYSVEGAADEAALEKLGDCERITLKRALKKISQENYVRKYDSAFSGFGAIHIVPAAIATDDEKLRRFYNNLNR